MHLLIAAPSTRAMAESAKKAGYNFVTLDYFGDADQKKICENYSLREFKEEFTVENLFKHAKSLEFTHLVYGSGFENHPELIEEFEKSCVVLGNSAKIIKKVRNWEYFFSKLKSLGIAHPKTRIVKVKEIRKLEIKNRIIKPVNTGGGHGIFTGKNFPKSLPSEERYLLQDYIKGLPASSLVISNGEKTEFLCATEQILDKFKYCGNIIPLNFDKKILKEIEDISIKICEEFNLIGCNGIDFVIKDKPYVIEVNPRITGAVEVAERALKINIFDLHVRACLGEKIKFKKRNPEKFYYKKIVFSKNNVRFNLKLDEVPPFIKDVPHFGEEIPKDKPLCTIVGGTKKREEVIKDIREKENLVNNLCY